MQVVAPSFQPASQDHPAAGGHVLHITGLETEAIHTAQQEQGLKR